MIIFMGVAFCSPGSMAERDERFLATNGYRDLSVCESGFLFVCGFVM